MTKAHTHLFSLLFLISFIQIQSNYSQMTQNELDSTLIEALKSGNHDSAKELVQAGANIDQIIRTLEVANRGGEGCWDYVHEESLLNYAAKRGDSNTVKGILKIKYNIENLEHKEIKQNNSGTIFSNIYAAIIPYIFKSEKSLSKNKTDDEIFTALYIALSNGHLNIVKEILQVPGIYENQKINFWLYNDALIIAIKKGYINISNELIKAKANVNYVDNDGYTALIAAASGGYDSIINELIKAKANVNYVDNDGYTALIVAASAGHDSIIRELIKAKVNVDHANNSHDKIIKELIKANANVSYQCNYNDNHTNIGGNTALIVAAASGHDSIIRELIRAKANVNHANNDGNTALIMAIKSQKLDAVKALLESKEININHTNKDGDTALMMAIKLIRTTYIIGRNSQYEDCVTSQEIAEMLFKVPGTNQYIANNKGETALSLLDKKIK